jgi:hypothetical protein
MEQRRSSHILSSAQSSGVGQADSVSSSIYTGRIEEQNQISTKSFLRSCAHRMDETDRHALIERQDMQASLQRLATRDDVYGVMVVTMDGRLLSNSDALHNGSTPLASLCQYARLIVRNLDPNDAIQALRLRTNKLEILITIRQDQLLVVTQILSNQRASEINVDQQMIEEDWDAFLKRVQERKTKGAH